MSGSCRIKKTITDNGIITSSLATDLDIPFNELAEEIFTKAKVEGYRWFRDTADCFGYVIPAGKRHIWQYISGDMEHCEPKMTLNEIYTQIHERVSWDTYGLKLAEVAALRADCTRRKVGAVLMAKDHSIIATGYNGGPPKGKSCLAGECPRGRMSAEELAPDSAYDTGGGTCVALHAEWNVLLRTAWHQFEGSTLYVTDKPCHICQVLISGTHITRVVAPHYEWTRP